MRILADPSFAAAARRLAAIIAAANAPATAATWLEARVAEVRPSACDYR
jgi:UDP:flavonoid glycosyltransferase YjiC (YdhE family)